jgi:plasmid stabilization system protein ParE
MPSWSRKDERQYEHIKESELERGASEDRAEEIDARTVNKHRREEGRTPSKRTQGTGNPSVALEERSRDELYNLAQELDIKGRSKMSKDELSKAIQSAGGRKTARHGGVAR